MRFASVKGKEAKRRDVREVAMGNDAYESECNGDGTYPVVPSGHSDLALVLLGREHVANLIAPEGGDLVVDRGRRETGVDEGDGEMRVGVEGKVGRRQGRGESRRRV